MSYVDKFGMLRGKSNMAVGSPCGKENLTAGGSVYEPLPNIDANELGPSISITSINVTGNVGTIVATAHGLSAGDIFRVAGADQYQYNGDKRADTVADANTITCVVLGSPTTPATGTMTLKKRQIPAFSDHI